MEREPLDFRQTLDLLASWEGRKVLVTSHSHAPGDPMSQTQTVLRGELGRLEMVESASHPDMDSAAGYRVGDAPNGLYMSAADFVHALRRGPTHLNVRFRGDFNFEVQLLDKRT